MQKEGRKNVMQIVKLYPTSALKVDVKDDLAPIKMNSTQDFEEAAAFAGLGLPSKVSEYGVAPQSEMEQIYEQQFVVDKLMLQFRVSGERLRRSQYGQIKSGTRQMLINFDVKANMDATDRFMNLAADAVNNPILGLLEAFASSTHATETGTSSNDLTPAESLSPQSITKLIALAGQTKSHKGFIMGQYVGPWDLHVSDQDLIAAEMIKMATGQAQEQSNNPNRVGKRINKIVNNPWQTNLNWHAIQIADKSLHGCFEQIVSKFLLTGFNYDEDNDSWKATALREHIYGLFGWRGKYFSRPA